MLHGSFFADRFGKPIREWMFRRAAELDADADLFVNDFDVVENSQLTEVQTRGLWILLFLVMFVIYHHHKNNFSGNIYFCF